MKLVLCSNERQIKGWKHHDVFPLKGIDYVCDLLDIEKHVKPESCTDIQFTHALEHFPQKETQKILLLIKSLMKEGGRLYIEVPNFMWHASLLMEGKQREAVYYAFGGQIDEYDFHKTGFTYQILKEELEKAGFRNIQISGSDCLMANCIK